MTGKKARVTIPRGEGKPRAIALFEQGYTPISPEIKALGLARPTVWGYFSRWKSESQPAHLRAAKLEVDIGHGEKIEGISEVKGKPTGKIEPVIDEVKGKREAKREAKPEISKANEVEPEELEPEELEPKPEPEVKPKARVPTLPDFIKGDGIPIRVEISAKSLAYFEMASTVASGNGSDLSLGDFIDDCISDFFEGRGSALGLVRLEEKE